MPSRVSTTTAAAAGHGASKTKSPKARRGAARGGAAVVSAAVAPAPAFPEDTDQDAMDVENDASLATNHKNTNGPLSLDDPWVYSFKPGESVWVRNHDKWIAGRIFPRSVPKIRSTDNLTYWNVLYQDAYGHKLRRCFAPLLGDLKPDTPRVRSLLREAHWIQ
uniref:PWWP domain-containing protein n=1 Tax=Mycena chlorophos TaxID=658473 RepID=A0ABQ0LAN3_MYCCL|nr:predicted protein [Mycena chlorophos]